MSPEHARGLPTDFRSDQFSFGLVLYEMTTGRRAFRRDTPAATLDAIVHDEPPRAARCARAGAAALDHRTLPGEGPRRPLRRDG